MEISSFGGTCLRFKGREGVVVADAYTAVVGPTGRGLTADICTYSHVEDQSVLQLAGAPGPRRGNGIRVPTSLSNAFLLDGPGEYEIQHVLITGVGTYRDEQKGAERGRNVSFVYELDGLRAVHVGEIGHLLTEEMIDTCGSVDVVCVPIGGALPAARAAELVTQLDAKLIVPMPLDTEAARPDLDRFLHEMSVQQGEPVAKLSVSASSLPQETTVMLLDARGRA
ncbi:MAG: MBL fold metallo-hydrolase [Chloroflexota bacterium]|nr:MBL fold metallo-hydrolase [Chloroflexota bacterium]